VRKNIKLIELGDQMGLAVRASHLFSEAQFTANRAKAAKSARVSENKEFDFTDWLQGA